MNNLYSSNTWDALFSDPFFAKTAKSLNTKPSTYPPYNVIKFPDNEFVISLAIAGFKKEDIEIKVQDGVLYIKGSRKEHELQEGAEYLYKGIGGRSFTRSFSVGDSIEVKGASFNDGILDILLVKLIPDEKKPKYIEIQ